MPSVSKRKVESRLYYKRVVPKLPARNQSAYSNQVIQDDWVVTPPRESRPKPESLIKNLTAHGPHSRTFNRAPPGDLRLERSFYSPYWKSMVYDYRAFLGMCTKQNVTYPEAASWITDLRLAIKDRKINLGATLAEYRQTVSMFRDAAIGIRDGVRAIRKLKKFKRRSLCSITNAHLIHDYGVAPLLSDVYDSVERLRDRIGLPVFERFHVQSWEQDNQSMNISRGTKWEEDIDLTLTTSKYVTAYVEFDLDGFYSDFTFGNPAEILWEVTPFSFVIDWMIPIGDALIALDALKGTKSIRGVVSTKHQRKQVSTIRPKGFADSSPLPSVKFTDVTRNREVLTGIPLPPIPKFDPTDSVKTLLNAVSLLVSVRGCLGVNSRFLVTEFYRD